MHPISYPACGAARPAIDRSIALRGLDIHYCRIRPALPATIQVDSSHSPSTSASPQLVTCISHLFFLVTKRSVYLFPFYFNFWSRMFLNRPHVVGFALSEVPAWLTSANLMMEILAFLGLRVQGCTLLEARRLRGLASIWQGPAPNLRLSLTPGGPHWQCLVQKIGGPSALRPEGPSPRSPSALIALQKVPFVTKPDRFSDRQLQDGPSFHRLVPQRLCCPLRRTHTNR